MKQLWRILALAALLALPAQAALAAKAGEYCQINSDPAVVSATTSSSRAVFPQAAARNRNVIVYNTGTVEVFVKTGSSTVTAATTNFSIPPGQMVTMSKAPGDDYIAAITASGSATLRATDCDGE